MEDLWTPAADSTLRDEFLGFTTYTFALIFGILVGILIIRQLTMKFAPTVLRTMIRSEAIKGKTVQDSDKALGTAVGVRMAMVVINIMIDDMERTGSPILMPSIAVSFLPGILQFIVAIALVVWAFRLVNIVQDVVALFDNDDVLDGTEKTLISAVQSTLRFVIIFVGAVFVADSMGFDLTSLIAGLGISGLALALAAKDSISNFFGAITVLLDRPFKIGDWVVVGSAEGEVIEINLRTTLVRTSVDTIITIPNANLVSTPVENWGKRRWRRWQSMIHLDINSDPTDVESFCKRTLELIRNHESTTKEESSWCSINTISAQSIDIGLNLYWNVSSSLAERSAREELILGTMELAKELNLSFYDGRIRQQR